MTSKSSSLIERVALCLASVSILTLAEAVGSTQTAAFIDTWHRLCILPSFGTGLQFPATMTSCSSSDLINVDEPGVDVARAKKKKLYPFIEARKIARGHGFQTKEEFIEYECAGAYQLPKNPDEVWKNEWRGWDDFLGVPLPFHQGREVARALEGIRSSEDYFELMRRKPFDDNDLASRLPFRPDLFYKSDWQSWDDWLGL